jgi:hypothetical protein
MLNYTLVTMIRKQRFDRHVRFGCRMIETIDGPGYVRDDPRHMEGQTRNCPASKMFRPGNIHSKPTNSAIP